jgi:hypothetical protein
MPADPCSNDAGAILVVEWKKYARREKMEIPQHHAERRKVFLIGVVDEPATTFSINLLEILHLSVFSLLTFYDLFDHWSYQKYFFIKIIYFIIKEI